MTPKYDLKQRVFFIRNNKVTTSVVDKILLEAGQPIMYYLDCAKSDPCLRAEDQIFLTKEELINSL